MNAPDGRAIALFVACACALLGASPLPGIGPDDYQHLVGLESPAIAPDGQHAALIVRHILWNDDRRSEELALVDLTTGAVGALVADRTGLSARRSRLTVRSWHFSPTTAKATRHRTQIFVMPATGGQERAVTHDPDGVDAFAWRPDSNAFAYTAADAPPEQTGADRFRDSFVFTTEPITARVARVRCISSSSRSASGALRN